MMPGGVMVPIADRQRERIQQRLPTIPVEDLDRIGGMYLIEREHTAERPAEVRESMQDIAEKAGALYVALATMSEESRHALDEACYPGRPTLWHEVESGARQLMGVARNANLDIQASGGRPQGPKRALVQRLATLLREMGIEPDARPKGELCFLTAEVLAAYGEDVGSARDIVRNALAETPAK